MKVIQSSIFRAICAIAIGAMLVTYPDNTVTWITIAIGIMFLLSGIFSCLTYFTAKKNANDYVITDADGNVISNGKPVFPIVGIGSIILGAILALMPSEFITALMYILGAILILGALNQFLVLFNARKWGRMSWIFWICPSLILITGLYIMVKPMDSASLPLLIIGWCSLLYGVTEIINAIKIYSNKKSIQKQMNNLANQQSSTNYDSDSNNNSAQQD